MELAALCDMMADMSPQLFPANETHAYFDSVRLFQPGRMVGGKRQLCIGRLEDFLANGIPAHTECLLIIGSADFFLANQGAFSTVNCLLLPETSNIPAVLDTTLDLLDQAQRTRDSISVLSQSMSSSIQSMELPQIIDAIYDLLGNPFSICNTEGFLIDYKAIDHLSGPSDLLFYHGDHVPIPQTFYKISEEVNQSSDPILYDTFASMDIRNYVGKITIGNSPVAYLLLLENDRPFTANDPLLIKIACQWLSVELQNTRVFLTPRSSLLTHFLLDLLNGRIATQESVTKHAELFRIPQKKWSNLLVVDCSNKELTPYSKQSLRRTLELQLPGSHGCFFQTYLLLYVNTDNYDFFSPSIRSFLEEMAKNNNIKIGLGYRYHDLLDSSRAYEQGRAAINFGSHINPDRFFYLYDDYALYHLLDEVNLDHDLRRYCHPKLMELIDYDKTYETSYTLTLYVLILSNARQAVAAKRLFIHRSTMQYRMDKIMEITGGMDFQDVRTLTRLFLSYSILIHTGELDPEKYSIAYWSQTEDHTE